MFYFLRFSYRFCQQKSTTSFNILFDNVFKRVKGKRKAASSRSAIEWIMRGAAEMFIVGTPIQKRVKRREESARGWREVSSKVLTRGGGRPRLEASLQASSLIHTSAPLVSSLISGTESWRTLSSRLLLDPTISRERGRRSVGERNFGSFLFFF